jgi:hypothetical protein
VSDHGSFLESMRAARGHTSCAKLAEYARTRGHSLTAQAIRNYELGRVPNKESRAILADILHLNEEHTLRLDHLCAHADMNNRWPEVDLFIVDAYARPRIAGHIVDTLLPDAGYEQRDALIKQVESILCAPQA